MTTSHGFGIATLSAKPSRQVQASPVTYFRTTSYGTGVHGLAGFKLNDEFLVYT